MKNIDRETPAIVISTLDERSRERLRRIETDLALAGFRNVEIMQARTPERDQFRERGLPEILQGRWRTDLQHMWGSAACGLSHLDLMKRGPSELPIIIFEDDATIHPQFFSYLDRIEFPDDVAWDVCHLSYHNDNLGSAKNPAGVINQHLVRCAPDETPSTYSYILNRPIIDRMTPLTEDIDFQLAHETDRIDSYVIEHTPPLTMPDFNLPSVRNDLDDIYWHENNPQSREA
ncbi:glycosyltransferase family 25 protein [Allorhodopirellula solitaria]|uniref:Glycosyltransferase family 25 (LPS biosynthesis protein) n=1 Tax=Allorhodopirellula solitaria TaxID=2527987 RepID=A0A5C5XV14_9BACT|nr:beta-1,4-galactosyltransferase [Allorhodopirellula solitaria]TWT66411.1 hypothetical protein CA85_25050 [Allorhodopirellula solitaria]